jgi:hypothetical protein
MASIITKPELSQLSSDVSSPLASEIKLDHRIGPRFGLQPGHVGHEFRHGSLAGPRPAAWPWSLGR